MGLFTLSLRNQPWGRRFPNEGNDNASVCNWCNFDTIAMCKPDCGGGGVKIFHNVIT